jgi:hypothetical protein
LITFLSPEIAISINIINIDLPFSLSQLMTTGLLLWIIIIIIVIIIIIILLVLKTEGFEC